VSIQLDGLGSLAMVVGIVVAARLLYDVARAAGIAAAIALYRARPRPSDGDRLSVAERIRNARKVAR